MALFPVSSPKFPPHLRYTSKLGRNKMTAPIMTGKFHKTDDLRIKEIKELLSPDQIRREFPLTEQAAQTTYETRRAIHRILHGADDRLLVIVGPCSIHDTKAAMEYARVLKAEKDGHDR